jgi:hypothetical protein
VIDATFPARKPGANERATRAVFQGDQFEWKRRAMRTASPLVTAGAGR